MFKFAALLASVALASAAPNAIQPRDGCVTAYIESFTLAAYNTTLPNTNTTGAPLVLGQAGAVDGGELFVLSTYASYPYNSYPTLAMSNGVIAATGSDNRPVASAPAAGDELNFAAPLEGDPDHAFCAAWSTDGQYTYELVVEGDAGSWWLCPAQYGQTNVVYKPDQNHSDEYDFDRCYPVRLHIVQ